MASAVATTEKSTRKTLGTEFDDEDITRIDQLKNREDRTRSAMIRILVREALDARDRKPKQR